MKQRLIYLLIFLLSISCVYALSAVILKEPINYENSTSSNIIFKCQAGYDVDNITLRFQSASAWYDIETKDALDFQDVSFSYNIPASGEYKWNCLATDTNNQQLSAPEDYTLTILPLNTAPTIDPAIPSPQEKDIDTNYWRLNLSEYANDNEDLPSELTWDVTGEDTSFCDVEIIKIGIDSMAQFTPSSSTSAGSDTITFILTDTGDLTDTQDITITLTETTCTESWNCGSWSDCSSSTQTRTCTDDNNCNTTTKTESRSCNGCDEDWTCGSWSTCSNGRQTRTCTDRNDCPTT